MSREGGADTAASVRQRLLNHARGHNRPFDEVLQHYALERFLYRLSQSAYATRFVLKGALMLQLWNTPMTRPTRDIDLLGRTVSDPATVSAVVKAICLQEVEPDGMAFDPTTVKAQRIIEDSIYAGVRATFLGRLGTARAHMQLDIGFGDIVVPEVTTGEYPTILDMPAPVITGYSRESLIAEKFEAMVKLDVMNSRMKDFYDVRLLCQAFDFDGAILASAIKQTFATRGTEMVAEPAALTDAIVREPGKQSQWAAFVNTSRVEGVPDAFAQVVTEIARFLGPVASALAGGRSFEERWVAPGPWAPPGTATH